MININKFLNSKKIVILTCYDATFASLIEHTKCDAILVGDSLGLTIKGEENTHKVTLDEMIYHTQAVRRGAKKIPIIADLPINTFKTKAAALKNAKKLIAAGANIIKIEGDKDIYDIVAYLSQNDIKVCGHIGYTPQTDSKIEKIKSPTEFLGKAKSLEVSGACMVVLSMTGAKVDKLVTDNLSIPTISFRSSNQCIGVVEIIYDILGLSINLSTRKKLPKNTSALPIKKVLNKFIAATQKK